MATLTRATLGKLSSRPTKEIKVGEHTAIIRRPSPLEYAKYQQSLYDPKTKSGNLDKFGDANMRLVAMMWIDDKGERLFSDEDYRQLNEIDNGIYLPIADACQEFASGKEAAKTLGESDEITPSDSPAGSA